MSVPAQRTAWAAILIFGMAGPGLCEDAVGQTEVAPTVEAPAPYDQRLQHLAEILGSVDYLRLLCKATDDGGWRLGMQDLIDRETANEPKRRERLTAAFNRGYRSFAAVYTTCTDAAVMAEQSYRAEGATLVAEIIARFGN